MRQGLREKVSCLTLVTFGFQQSKCNPSLLIRSASSHKLYVLVHVDDIIVTGTSAQLVQSLITRLNIVFSIKQLGNVDYFLGIEVKHIPNGSLLLHKLNILELLNRSKMMDAKGLPTPIVNGCKLTKYGGNYVADPSLYRSIVGALQYATIMCPEVSYSVNKVCQFLSQPLEEH